MNPRRNFVNGAQFVVEILSTVVLFAGEFSFAFMALDRVTRSKLTAAFFKASPRTAPCLPRGKALPGRQDA